MSFKSLIQLDLIKGYNKKVSGDMIQTPFTAFFLPIYSFCIVVSSIGGGGGGSRRRLLVVMILLKISSGYSFLLHIYSSSSYTKEAKRP